MTTGTSQFRIEGWADARARIFRSKMVVVGLIILTFFAILTFIHPVLQATIWAGKQAIYRPETGHDPAIFNPSGPSLAHILGTDPLGRDVLSLMTFGLRPTFLVAISTGISAGVIGMVVGTSAAFFKGRGDRVLTHMADAFVLLPPPLIFLIASKRGLLGPIQLGLLYGLFYGLGPATIVVRARALSVMEKLYIDAARLSGRSAGDPGIHRVPRHRRVPVRARQPRLQRSRLPDRPRHRCPVEHAHGGCSVDLVAGVFFLSHQCRAPRGRRPEAQPPGVTVFTRKSMERGPNPLSLCIGYEVGGPNPEVKAGPRPADEAGQGQDDPLGGPDHVRLARPGIES